MKTAVACMHGGVMLERRFHVTVTSGLPQIYQLLTFNYVEDDDNMFRCAAAAYSTGHPGRVWAVAALGSCGVARCSQHHFACACAYEPAVRKFERLQDGEKWALQPLGTGSGRVLDVRTACAHKPAWRAGSTTRRTS